MTSAFVRRLCHTAYIWRRVNDCESQPAVFPGLFSPLFPYGVFWKLAESEVNLRAAS
jgi:hypothetical protein